MFRLLRTTLFSGDGALQRPVRRARPGGLITAGRVPLRAAVPDPAAEDIGHPAVPRGPNRPAAVPGPGAASAAADLAEAAAVEAAAAAEAVEALAEAASAADAGKTFSIGKAQWHSRWAFCVNFRDII